MQFKYEKINFIVILLVIEGASFLFAQSSFENYLQQEQSNFQNYSLANTMQYNQFDQENQLREEAFRRSVEEKWEEFKSPTAKVFVDYDKDFKSRTSVDFENGEIEIEILIEDSSNPAELNQQLMEKVEAIYEKETPNNEALLAKQLDVSESDGTFSKPAAEKLIKSAKKHESINRAKDGVARKKISVKIPMKSNHLSTRAAKYRSQVEKQSARFDLNPAIVMAIIETESAFNPLAKSHVPAFGLMQLVPKSGARDAYNFLYKKDKYIDSKYLFDADKNIELGCAYLKLIRDHYFKGIQDIENSYLCTIPAYNTGIGNVAIALTGKPKLKAAVAEANLHSASQLRKILEKKLRYKEARDYLNRVWKRKGKY